MEDNAVSVDLMQNPLENGEAYDVVSMPSGCRGFEFVKQVQPDLITLDPMLGRRQTVWPVLGALREDPATAPSPVILCSAVLLCEVSSLAQARWKPSPNPSTSNTRSTSSRLLS
jgi:CheY-like chemotaxis protein